MKLFDAHCHLQLPQYDADREAVLARMQEQGMGAMIIGTDFETSKAGLELAKQYDFLWASVGLHPNDNKDEHYDISKYEELAQNPKVVAIGECGLDYFRSEKSEGQKERFEAQIKLAQKINKALVVHCRNAHDDCYSILQKARMNGLTVPVVMHFFTGSGELAQKYLDLGCYLSFPGPVTYTDMYDESIRLCPLEKMLVETDAPFAAPVPNRGKRNEPAYVAEVAKKIAAVKGLTEEEVAAQTVLNSQRIFGLAN
ncbi:MAG: TatD family hydrolase [Patescibacteria group bacterium]